MSLNALLKGVRLPNKRKMEGESSQEVNYTI